MLALGRWKGTLVQEDIPLPYLKLTANLDYLVSDSMLTLVPPGERMGKAECEGSAFKLEFWEFLPLTSPTWSVNTYCHPKLYPIVINIDIYTKSLMCRREVFK